MEVCGRIFYVSLPTFDLKKQTKKKQQQKTIKIMISRSLEWTVIKINYECFVYWSACIQGYESISFITPTNHSHAKPLSVPILVNYFLWNVFMENIKMLFYRL